MACRDRQRAEAAIKDIVQVRSREREEKLEDVCLEDSGSALDLLLLFLLLVLCLRPQETGNQQVVFMLLDLASLKSVRSFAGNFLQSESRLDLLINNAGELLLTSHRSENNFSITTQDKKAK